VTIDTTELRKASTAVYLAVEAPVAKDLSDKLRGSADEIDALRRALAEVPHAELCRLLMVRDDEPCSCAKSALPAPAGLTPAIPDAVRITYLDARSLTVAGPHGPVLGLPRVASVRVDRDDDHLTVSYTNP
jgi:hypothetical protein